MGEAFLLNNDYSLVEWKKWSCDYTPSSDIWYEEAESSESGSSYIGQTGTMNWGGDHMNVSATYGFSRDKGYYEIDYISVPIPDVVGYYDVMYDRVLLYTNVTQRDLDTYYVDYEVVAVVRRYYYQASYDKGNISYGSILSIEGELPETGSLIEGGTNQNYCILLINGTNYYYEKI